MKDEYVKKLEEENRLLKKQNRDIKNLFKFNFSTTYSDEYELLRKIIKIYVVMKDISLPKKEVEIMTRYMRFGYNKDTRDNIVKDFDMKGNYIFTMTTRLIKKGVLEKSEYNKKKTKVASELIELRDYILSKGEIKTLPIIFYEKLK